MDNIILKMINYKSYIPMIIFILNLSFAFVNATEIVVHNSSNEIQMLDESWNINIENNDIVKKTTIPYFIEDQSVGNITFQKEFTLKKTINFSKIRIWILGIHGQAKIYLNNVLLKEHLYVPHTYYIDIDPNLLKKEFCNLKIVISKYDENGNLIDLRYPNYPKQLRPIGISQKIYLEYFPFKYLDNIRLKYSNKTLTLNYNLSIKDSLKNRNEKTIKIVEEVISPEGNIVHRRFEYIKNEILEKTINRKIKIRTPAYWSNTSPNLYTIKFKVKTSSKEYYSSKIKYGLRNIKTLEQRFILNDSLVTFKGTNYRFNFNNPNQFINKAVNDLYLIKNLGFNSVRFVNYIPPLQIVKHADSIGLYLFIDNGIWRIPPSFYSKSESFNIIKLAAYEAADVFSNHASVVALGTGNESYISSPAVKKFKIVLYKYLNENFNFLTYQCPIDFTNHPYNEFSDFLILTNYLNPEKLFYKYLKFETQNIPLLLGNINFPINVFNSQERNHISDTNKLKQFFFHYDSLKKFSGYFIDSFNDWEATFPNIYTIKTNSGTWIYPFGLMKADGSKSEKYLFYADKLKDRNPKVAYYKNTQSTNFYSIIVFIISIIFFLLYKQNYRLRENLLRSLQHPYGFFVDLRDRRIISVFNSTLMGITVGIIISAFIASIIFANYDSILFDEVINLVIKDIDLKILYLSLVSSSWKLFAFIFAILTILQIMFILFIKIVTFFSKEKRKFRQIYSIISWSGSPFLFFIPVSIFAYTLSINNILYLEIIWIFLLFFVWYNFRLANGFRVLYLIQPFKMLVIVFLTYLTLIITFLGYLNFDNTLINNLKLLNVAKHLY